MRFKIIIILFFISILPCKSIFSQTGPHKPNSNKIYRKIELYSNRHRITKYMYRAVFRPVVSSTSKDVKKDSKKKKENKNYRAFEGKVIRNIVIETLDPFGFSIGDTIESFENGLSKAANTLHLKTRQLTIKNLLLIQSNQIFDSLLVKESERLIRNRPYVQDVSFYVVRTSKKSDSVDIYIRVLDTWSIFLKVEGSPLSPTFNLTEKNFLGFGHESKTNLTRYLPGSLYAYNTSYYIPNFRNTYINSSLGYRRDQYENYIANFGVDRPFFSSYAKWAAGANFTRQFRRDSLHFNDSTVIFQSLKSDVQDYWAGYAFKVFKGNSENSRTTNLIASMRYLQINYHEKPIESIDSLHLYANEKFYMAAIGLSTRKYVQDKFIFRYGVTEDVPVGKVFSLTGGYQEKNTVGRVYLGARISYSNYYKWGYLSSNIEYGSFYHSAHSEQGILTIGANYFTGLLEIGNWKIRQFAKSQITFGLNRFSYEKLTINDNYGIEGFTSSLTGTNRFLLTLQTQSYAPWEFIGFRFGPYLSYSLGMLSDPNTGFTKSKVYSHIALGVLIKNEYLVINTFQFSISFYPIMPGNGIDVFKTNSIRTNDFGFRDFGIGKPATIEFQ